MVCKTYRFLLESGDKVSLLFRVQGAETRNVSLLYCNCTVIDIVSITSVVSDGLSYTFTLDNNSNILMKEHTLRESPGCTGCKKR